MQELKFEYGFDEAVSRQLVIPLELCIYGSFSLHQLIQFPYLDNLNVYEVCSQVPFIGKLVSNKHQNLFILPLQANRFIVDNDVVNHADIFNLTWSLEEGRIGMMRAMNAQLWNVAKDGSIVFELSLSSGEFQVSIKSNSSFHCKLQIIGISTCPTTTTSSNNTTIVKGQPIYMSIDNIHVIANQVNLLNATMDTEKDWQECVACLTHIEEKRLLFSNIILK